ncbi:MAG: hypothetical protein WBN40_01555 [Pseudomonadales bacterium]
MFCGSIGTVDGAQIERVTETCMVVSNRTLAWYVPNPPDSFPAPS